MNAKMVRLLDFQQALLRNDWFAIQNFDMRGLTFHESVRMNHAYMNYMRAQERMSKAINSLVDSTPGAEEPVTEAIVW